MPRRGVQGPNSALSEFLKDRGISIPNRHKRGRNGQDSDDLSRYSEDAPIDSDDSIQYSKKLNNDSVRSSPKAVSSELSLSPKSEIEIDKFVTSVQSNDTQDLRNFSYLSRLDNVAYCTVCKSRFRTCDDLNCHKCTFNRNDNPIKKKIKQRPSEKAARLDGRLRFIPKLSEICIKLIAQRIENINLLEKIGSENLSKICRIISKNRALTHKTLQLFLDSKITNLRLWDCSKLEPQSFILIAHKCPLLEELELYFCGNLTDEAIYAFSKLKNLKKVAFGASFIVTKNCWNVFFQNIGNCLQSYEISNTSRFQQENFEILVENCSNLTSLAVERLTEFNDDCLLSICKFEKLERLSIKFCGNAVKSENLVKIIIEIGSNLQILELEGINSVNDDVLLAIRQTCRCLTNLSLYSCGNVTNVSIEDLFTNWRNPGLRCLNLGRCFRIADDGLVSALIHSGETLEKLNINSLHLLSHKGLTNLANKKLANLRYLDVGFVRALDDDILDSLFQILTSLNTILIWGNNQISKHLKSVREIAIIGQESYDL